MKNQTKKFTINNNTVALLLSMSKWNTTRVGNLALIDTETDKAMLKLGKKLIESQEYDAIGKYMYYVGEWVKSRSVPSFFRDGCYLLSLDMVEKVEQYLSEKQAGLEEKIAAFALVYEKQVQDAQERLKGMFREQDYPSVERLKKSFYWAHQWVTFSVPDALPESIKKQELDKMQNMWDEAAVSITMALRESFKKLITHAIDKLTPGEDGKQKRLYDTTITNITDFIDTFKDRNVTNDIELAELVEKAKIVLTGVPETKKLKDNESAKAVIAEGFAELVGSMEVMTVPKRAFDL